MAITHKNIMYRRNPYLPKSGDIIDGGNYSFLLEHSNPWAGIKNLTFKGGINVKNFELDPSWDMGDSVFVNVHKTYVKPTPEDNAEAHASDLAERLKIIAESYPASVARGTKGQWKPNTMSQVLSADGDAVEVKDVGGRWPNAS